MNTKRIVVVDDVAVQKKGSHPFSPFMASVRPMGQT